MKAISKNLGKLNQYVGERFSKTPKHEVTEEFKALQESTEIRKAGTDAILDALLAYLKTLEKKVDSKQSAIETFGLALSNLGSDLNEDSAYGQALLKLGEIQTKMAAIQMDYASKARAEFVVPLEAYMAEMKIYKHLRTKLENRRLDYDAKLNRIQKSKKEKPELDEEMRIAQQKYDETLTELEQLMVSLNEREDQQLQDLLNFLEAQHSFHTQAAHMLVTLKSTILDQSVKGVRVHSPRQTYMGTPLSERVHIAPPTPEPPGGHSTAATDNITYSRSRIAPPPTLLAASVSQSSATLGVPVPSIRKSSSSLSTDTAPSSTVRTARGSHEEPSITVSHPSLEQKLVRAQYSFYAENKEELSIGKGDTILVISELSDGWWIGELNGQRGIFPVNYCEPISLPSAQPQAQPHVAPSPIPVIAAPMTPEPARSIKVPGLTTSASLSQIRGPREFPRSGAATPSNTSLKEKSMVPAASLQGSKLAGGMENPFGDDAVILSSAPGSQPTLANNSQQQPSRNNSQQDVRKLTPVQKKAISVGICATCGCEQYAANVFKAGQCNNCFHAH